MVGSTGGNKMETRETTISSFLSEEDKKILEYVDNGFRVTDIARELGVSKSKISKKLRKFTILGLVNKRNRHYYLTSKGRFYLSVSSFSMGSVGGLRVEGLRVVFGRVLFRGGWRDFVFGGRRTGLQNVDQVVLDGPEDTRVYVSFGRVPSVMVVFPRQTFSRFRFFSELLGWFNFVLWRVIKWLTDNGVVVDISSMRVVAQETASKAEEFDEAVEQRKATVDLGRTSITPIGESNIKARAWIDRSHRKLEIESNDLVYVEKLLMMPEIVYALNQKLTPILVELSDQIKLHLEVMRKMSDTLDKISMYFGGHRDIITYLLENSLCLDNLFKR